MKPACAAEKAKPALPASEPRFCFPAGKVRQEACSPAKQRFTQITRRWAQIFTDLQRSGLYGNMRIFPRKLQIQHLCHVIHHLKD